MNGVYRRRTYDEDIYLDSFRDTVWTALILFRSRHVGANRMPNVNRRPRSAAVGNSKLIAGFNSSCGGTRTLQWLELRRHLQDSR